MSLLCIWFAQTPSADAGRTEPLPSLHRVPLLSPIAVPHPNLTAARVLTSK